MAIIVRAVSVLAEVRWTRVLPLVLAPAALEAFVGSSFERLSLVGIMGGVRLEPHTTLLVDATNFTSTVSLFLFIGSLVALFFVSGQAKQALFRPAAAAPKELLIVALGMFAAWIAAAVPMHPQLANRRHLEQLLNEDDFPHAIAFASGKVRGDFPPHHHLPPTPSAYFNPQLIIDLPADAPAWLRDEWIQNAIEARKMGMFFGRDPWEIANSLYPQIPIAVARHADELRERRDKLDADEEHWLQNYESQEKEAAPP